MRKRRLKIMEFNCYSLRQPVLVRFLVLVFLRFTSSFPPSFCCEELPWDSAKVAFVAVAECSSMMKFFALWESRILRSNSRSDSAVSFRTMKSQTPVDETVSRMLKRTKRLQDSRCIWGEAYITLEHAVR
jgi:hypothetical protein